jgi:electron transfer flavoprotein beta subunit
MERKLRILVAVKHGIDVGLARADRTTGTVALESAPRKTSDFDRNAVEEAVRIRERHGGTITAISVGAPTAREALRDALTIGADAAVLVTDAAIPSFDTRAVGRALAAVSRTLGGFDIFLFGEGSSDHFSGLVGPRVAAELGVADVAYVRKLTIEDGGIVAEKDLERELEIVRAPFPVVLTVGQEINTPRLPTFMATLKASKKEIREMALGEIGLDPSALGAASRIDRVAVPEVPRKLVQISGSTPEEAARALVAALRSEGALP